MSSSYIHKPESALRRAEELRSISQDESALTLLHDVLSSRRHRTWSPTYEKIMILYLDICLLHNKSREAKDGLHQYRNLSQIQAPGSLEVVIRYLMEESERNVKEAKEKADEGMIDGDLGDDDDVDEENEEGEESGIGGGGVPSSMTNANMLLLSTMSLDPAQSQRDSTLLLPRIKFLWESYRAVLDILKSNSKLERLYHLVAVNALEFCATYKRRTEFRRLCDLLRMHLQNLQKYGGVAAMAKVEEGGKPNNKIRGWEGWTTESIELHLQTRFTQLETASILHLYTEGFRTVEDIFNILQISHSRRKVAGSTTAPKAKIMAAYYQKLTTLFWVSENYLFHAFAWYKFYTLCKEYNRTMSKEQQTLQASAVLLSALCIPTLPDRTDTLRRKEDGSTSSTSNKMTSSVQDEIAKEKTARMATLLGFHTRYPTREALLSEIRAKNVMADVPDYLRDLYKLLEENTNPLVLVEKAKPLLDRLRNEVSSDSSSDESMSSTNLSSYVEPLISVFLLKLLHSLSASYHTISLDHVQSLTSGLGVSFTQVEKAIIAAATAKNTPALLVRIDHRAKCLRFGDFSTGSRSNLESDSMRSQLSILARQLSSVCNIITPPDLSALAKHRHLLYSQVRTNIDKEHDEMLARKDVIEKRKEEVERLAQEQEKREELKRLEAQANARVEEEKRLAREKQLREKEKLEKIRKEMEISEKKNYLKAMGESVDTMTEEELLAIDTDALAKEHAAKAAKKRDDAERKVRELQKKLDYVVRATRIEEVPIVKSRQEAKVKFARDSYEAEVVEKNRNAKSQWEEDCKQKAALSVFSVFDCMKEFENSVMVGRKVVHEVLCNEEDARAEIAAENAKLQRARKRKDDAIRRKKDEEARLKREEEKRQAEEERLRREEERKKKQEEEDQRKRKELERMAEKEREGKDHETNDPPPASKDLDTVNTTNKYVPPSKRNSNGYSDSSRSSSFNDSRSRGFGGMRYEGGDRYSGSSRQGSDRYGGRQRDDRGPPEQRNNRWGK